MAAMMVLHVYGFFASKHGGSNLLGDFDWDQMRRWLFCEDCCERDARMNFLHVSKLIAFHELAR
jgi:hypothetical protein